MPRLRYPCFVVLILLLSATAPAPLFAMLRFDGPAKYGVYIADLSAGRIHYVGAMYDWSLSPDGKWIAGRDDGTIALYNVATGKTRLLKRHKAIGPAISPTFGWSRDSRWLVVSCDWNTEDSKETETVDTFAVLAETNTVRPPKDLKTAATHASSMKSFRMKGYQVTEAAHSPNRKLVAAICVKGVWEEYTGGLFVAAPNGSHPVQITKFLTGHSSYRDDAIDCDVRWLPDGKRVVFRRTSQSDEGI